MKQEIKNIPLIHPTTICLIGTLVDNKPNFTTIGDIAVAGINPPLVMVSINTNHGCMDFINSEKIFSINMTSEKMLNGIDHAGMYSSKIYDKSNLFKSKIIDKVPIIEESPIALIVRVNKRVQIEHRVILVCDVIKTFIEEKYINVNIIDLASIKSVLYGLDNNYYTIGEKIGVGYEEGNKISAKKNN